MQRHRLIWGRETSPGWQLPWDMKQYYGTDDRRGRTENRPGQPTGNGTCRSLNIEAELAPECTGGVVYGEGNVRDPFRRRKGNRFQRALDDVASAHGTLSMDSVAHRENVVRANSAETVTGGSTPFIGDHRLD